jgi:hypothetical protein
MNEVENRRGQRRRARREGGSIHEYSETPRCVLMREFRGPFEMRVKIAV